MAACKYNRTHHLHIQPDKYIQRHYESQHKMQHQSMVHQHMSMVAKIT